MPKACAKYLGVRIYRDKEEIVGTAWRVLKSGEWIPKKPKYITRYKFADGYLEDTLKQCKESIRKIWEIIQKREIDISVKEFADIMNEGKI